MAFKRSVSTYFTNEKQFTRFSELALSEGKSQSKKIMDVIEKELQVSRPQSPGDLLPGCTSFRPFTSYESLSSTIYSGFAFCPRNSDNTSIKKEIFELVDSRIKDNFTERLKVSPGPHNKKRFIIIKLSLDISYQISSNKAGETCIQGHYSHTAIFFELTERLWLKYEGRYDLTNIKYRKYLNLFKPQKKQRMIALLFERKPSPDNAGGFFIPVNPAGLNYPEILNEKKFDFIPIDDYAFNDGTCGIYLQLAGADVYSNINRVKLTQIEKIKKSVRMNTATRFKPLKPQG